jgi:phytoene dehydrogenase-like protein
MPDAIVIGAGHNGLVAANLLADAGWDVLVCEAAPVVGGAVRSAEVTAPGYVSDLFSAFYPLAAASPVLQGLELDRHGLRWSYAPSVLAHVFPDDRVAVLSRDAERTAESVARFHPGDGDAWKQIVREWQRVEPLLLGALFQPFPPVRSAARLARRLGAADLLRFARFAALPVRRFGQERFRGEGAPLLLAGNALHADLSPDAALGALYGWLLCMLGQSYGFPVPVGGAGELTAALARRFERAGGSIRTSAPVERIVIEHDRAVGVRLRGGETVRAGRAVLADVTAPPLYRDLVGVEHLPGRLVQDLDHFEWDTATIKINWALSGRIPWTATEACDAGTVHLGVDLDGLSDYANDLATRRDPEHPFVLFGQMTTSDPSRSPAGTESAWAYTHIPRQSRDGSRSEADRVAGQVGRVTALLERHAPGFGELVVDRHVQSPTDLAAENPSLVGGAINGGTAQLHQQLVFRPVPGLGRSETVIDRLYLASSSAHPGGGVHGACGANAARAALAREGRSGGLRQGVTAALHRRLYR